MLFIADLVYRNYVWTELLSLAISIIYFGVKFALAEKRARSRLKRTMGGKEMIRVQESTFSWIHIWKHRLNWIEFMLKKLLLRR